VENRSSDGIGGWASQDTTLSGIRISGKSPYFTPKDRVWFKHHRLGPRSIRRSKNLIRSIDTSIHWPLYALRTKVLSYHFRDAYARNLFRSPQSSNQSHDGLDTLSAAPRPTATTATSILWFANRFLERRCGQARHCQTHIWRRLSRYDLEFSHHTLSMRSDLRVTAPIDYRRALLSRRIHEHRPGTDRGARQWRSDQPVRRCFHSREQRSVHVLLTVCPNNSNPLKWPVLYISAVEAL
jgi:hypothetical protein